MDHTSDYPLEYGSYFRLTGVLYITNINQPKPQESHTHYLILYRWVQIYDNFPAKQNIHHIKFPQNIIS